MITIILADDHALVRQGIRALLERTGEVTVLAEAADGKQAVQLTRELKPDILLVDLSMPRLNGIEVIEQLAHSGSKTRVIVVSMHAEETIVRRALRTGAKGYLLKDSFKEELFLAVRAAARHQIYLTPTLAEMMLNPLITQPALPATTNPIDNLSARERETLQLILEGHTNRQMAEILGISIKTVDKHRTNLMKKLKVHDVATLFHVATQNGVLYGR